MILIVTNSEDKTVDYLLKEIQRPVFRLDTDLIIEKYNFKYTNEDFYFSYLESKDYISSKEIKGIIYRRPVNPIINLENENNDLKNELSLEARTMYESIINSINTKWMSNPFSIRKAENKLLQLKIAKEIGFKIPDSIITNNYEDLLKFINRKQCEYCIKPLFMGVFEMENNKYIPYNNLINKDDDLSLIKNFPALIQEYIEKKYEIRVIIVSNKIFAIKINSQIKQETKIDWRINNCMSVDYNLIVLPESIQNLCLTILNRFNLNFSSMDLIVDINDNYYFLDLNPNGQWAWIDQILKLNISKTIGDYFYE